MQAYEYVRPSAAANLLRCFGYAQLNALVGAPFEDENEDTEVREDGTACHWLAEQRLTDVKHPSGTVSPNARVITDEMQGAVDEYVRIMGDGEHWVIEEKAPVSTVIAGMQDGTPDAWSFNSHTMTLTILDLKFGYRFVDAYENIQLTIYALTIIFAVLKLTPDNVKVRLGIFQPRAPNHMGALRWWSPTPTKLYEMHAMIVAGVWQCLQPNALCTPHPGCKTCPAAHACHALRMAASRDTEVAYAPVPAILDNERLGYELSIRHAAAKMLESQIAGLETQAEHALRHGERVSGYELGPRRTLWRWKEGAAQLVAALAASLKIEAVEVKTKSVAQLRALLPKEVVELYAEKPNGGFVLKPIDPKDAERRFNQE